MKTALGGDSDDGLVTDWLLMAQTPPDTEVHRGYEWAYDRLLDLLLHDPDYAWRIILKLVERSPTSDVLSRIGAGPLEDLMRQHGTLVIDRLELEAKTNEILREAMRGAWLDEEDTPTWWRFYEAAGIEPPFDD